MGACTRRTAVTLLCELQCPCCAGQVPGAVGAGAAAQPVRAAARVGAAPRHGQVRRRLPAGGARHAAHLRLRHPLPGAARPAARWRQAAVPCEQAASPACAPARSCQLASSQGRVEQMDCAPRPCPPCVHAGGAAAAVAAPLRGAGDQRAHGAHRVCAQHRLHPRHQGQEPAPHLPARPLPRALRPRGERKPTSFAPPCATGHASSCAQLACYTGRPLPSAAPCRARRSGRRRSEPSSRAWPPTAWCPTSCRCRPAHFTSPLHQALSESAHPSLDVAHLAHLHSCDLD